MGKDKVMCLDISCYYNPEEDKKEIIGGKKKIYGYKLLWDADITKPGSRYISVVYQSYSWYPNKKIYRSGRESPILTSTERKKRQVDKGFHFYRTREIARNEKVGYSSRTKIVQFEIDAKDIVAFDAVAYEFVATKCRWLKVVR